MIAFKIEVEREDDGRWLAQVVELPGVLAYGETQEAAPARVQALALRVIAERLEHGEARPDLLSMTIRHTASMFLLFTTDQREIDRLAAAAAAFPGDQVSDGHDACLAGTPDQIRERR